mmetsp:Transcript_14418/g.33533  ORF Transcript_14418/g.33533 Transcript_14418/m.33533 type:complete len:212 (+) Transcript_14418:90-725(+)
MFLDCIFAIALVFGSSRGAVRCETEDDLDFDICGLVDMKDEVLFDICDRIGLSMEEHVLPFLFEDDENSGDPRSYSHEEYVRGAEECLLVENELSQLGEDELDSLEMEALEDDPELLAQVITDVLKQDDMLLREIAYKLETDGASKQAVLQVADLLSGEQLENRADVVGFLLAELLQDNPNILDEFDEAIAALLDDDQIASGPSHTADEEL